MTPAPARLAPPAAATVVAPSFVERLQLRTARGHLAALRAEARLVGVKLGDGQLEDYAAAIQALLELRARLIVTFGKHRAEMALCEHRAGPILFARTDLVLCPAPRNFLGDPYIPGAPHRLRRVRFVVTERARATDSPALEWEPATGEVRALHVVAEAAEA